MAIIQVPHDLTEVRVKKEQLKEQVKRLLKNN